MARLFAPSNSVTAARGICESGFLSPATFPPRALQSRHLKSSCSHQNTYSESRRHARLRTIIPERFISKDDFQRYQVAPPDFWSKDLNVLDFLAAFEKAFDIHDAESWNQITPSLVDDFAGTQLLSIKDLGSVLRLKYPTFEWAPWCLGSAPQGFWKDLRNQYSYMKWLSRKHGRVERAPEDWYSIKKADFVDNHGSYLITRIYKSSPHLLLTTLYPNVNWQPWRFESPPNGLWSKKETRRDFMDWLAGELKYLKPDDFYNLNASTVSRYGGSMLLKHYKGVHGLLKDVYPEHNFLPWKFPSVPASYWNVLANRQRYIAWLIKELNLKSEKELKLSHFIENHGYGLAAKYGNSPSDILLSLNDPSRTIVSTKKKNYYASVENQRVFADKLARDIGFDPNDVEKWYGVTNDVIRTHGGEWILRSNYNYSIYYFLRAVYPHVVWKPWLFKKVSKKSLSDPEAIKVAVDFAASSLDIDSLDSWKRVSKAQLQALRVYQFFDKNGGIEDVSRKYWSPPLKSASKL